MTVAYNSCCLLFYSAVRVELTFVPTKVSKIRRRDVQSTFCKKNFIESNAVVIRKLISLTPKNTRQQREMIRVFLRCFLQKLFQQTVIPHSTAYLLMGNFVLLCGTYFPTKKQVCGGGLENVCESAVIVP